MIAKWVFDYNIVAALDPSYVQYLEDIDWCNKDTWESDPIHSVPIVPRTNDNYYQEKRSGLSEEEKEVLDFMHSTNTEKPLANDEIISNPEAAFVHAQEASMPYPPLRPEVVESRKKAKAERREKNHLLRLSNSYVLKEEYRDPKAATNPIPVERQLAPPKTVCGAGTEILYNNDIYHKLIDGSYHDASINIRRVRFSVSNGVIRLITCRYWFDRIKNVTSEKKDEFRSLVYNPKTKQMYSLGFNKEKIKSNPDRHKYTRTIRNCGIASHMIEIVFTYANNCPPLANKFMRAVFDAIIKDVPDAAFDSDKLMKRKGPNAYPIYQLCHGILEHKVGKRIDWMTKDIYERLLMIMDYRHLLIEIEGRKQFKDLASKEDGNRWNLEQKMCARDRSKRIGNIVPYLRKHNNLRSCLEALLGKWYSKALFDIFYWGKIDTFYYTKAITQFSRGIPKIAYHYLVGIIRYASSHALSDSAHSAVAKAVKAVLTAENTLSTNDNNTTEWFRSYIMFCKRLTNPAEGQYNSVPRWDTWRDMYQMAARYNIRIRPNKFKRMSDVSNFHQRLSDIQNRDKDILRNLEGKEFEPFAHPDKEYGGFKFVHLTKPEDLVHEGITMHHCVAGYSNVCFSGDSIIFSMRKEDRSYVTIELSGNNLKLRQVYTIHDFTVENEGMKEIISDWHQDVLSIHKDDKALYKDICQYKQNEERLKRINEVKASLENMTLPPTQEDIRSMDDMNLALEA